MVNISLASAAVAAAMAFYFILDDAITARPVAVVVVHSWYCGGWDGAMYPTEKSMRKAFK